MLPPSPSHPPNWNNKKSFQKFQFKKKKKTEETLN